MPSLDIKTYFFWLIAASVVAFVVERSFVWRSKQRVLRPGWLQDLFWLIFNGHFVGMLLAHPAGWAIGRINDAFSVVLLPAPETLALLTAAPLAVQFIVVLVVKDFFEWCIHILLHRVPWIWEFHKVHHSIRELDWIGNFRFHWMESVIYGALTYLPLVILGIDPRVLLANAVFGTMIGHLNHANIRTDWGPLRYVLNSPRLHVWHHDVKMHRGYGQNYAIVLSVWDWIFRTAYYPSDEEQPARIGFEGDDEFVSSLLGRFTHPVSTWFLSRR